MNDMHKSISSCGFEPMDSSAEPLPNYYSMQSTLPTATSTSTSASLLLPLDSGIQSANASSFPSTLPSSSSTTISEYPPQQPPSNALLADFTPSKVIEELQQYIANENDKVVLTSSVAVLFSYSINSIHGEEVCHLVSASQVILNALYKLLTDDEFKDDDPILFLATGNLTNISNYPAGRSAILGCNGLQAEWPSRGVRSLIKSLQSRDSNVVIVAITAVHNLLIDERLEVQDIAKKQIKQAQGIEGIVKQLANQSLVNNYEFKVIVLDCLQILAYGNPENRLTILRNEGPKLLLKIIEESLNNPSSEELFKLSSRVLKSLSVCLENKMNIIHNDGIEILTRCIKLDHQETLKTCLWTLRNLSDVINKSEPKDGPSVNQLVERLLEILNHYSEEPCIVTCALGVLANLTCNNEPVKQFICNYNGVELLLCAIETALRDSRDFKIGNTEILEPAVCALCHLLNQPSYPRLELERQRVFERFTHDGSFNSLIHRRWSMNEADLAKAVDKLKSLIGPGLTWI